MTPPLASRGQVEAHVAARLGMRCDDSLRLRLDDALDLRLRQLRLDGLDDYLLRLDSPDGAAELEALAQHLTIGETYFFRGTDHFRALADTVLPERIRRNAGTHRLRLLSLACSSGEEPYSLAMLITERFPELASWQVDIVGADINQAALTKARRGVYTPWSLRDMPEHQVRRHFSGDGRRFEIAPDLRQRVHFQAINLMDEGAFGSMEPFDVVLFRNALIYFTPAAISAVLQGLQRIVARDGYLFLGHSESLRGYSRAFRLCRSQDSFYYQLADAHAPAPPLPDDHHWDDVPDAATPAPEPFDDDAWLGAIDRSTQRVAQLATARPPPPAPASPPRSDAVLLDEALALLRRERYAELLHRIGDRSDPGLLLLAAAALLQQARHADAERHCRRLLALDELDADATYLLALCREQAGDAAEALRLAHAASYLDAGFAMPQVLAGRIERRQQAPQRARIALSRAVTLLPLESERRWLLFGGGFSREALVRWCHDELARCRGLA